jgi:hypothetical protein
MEKRILEQNHRKRITRHQETAPFSHVLCLEIHRNVMPPFVTHALHILYRIPQMYCMSPPGNQRGAQSPAGEGGGEVPIPTTGEKALHSVYSVHALHDLYDRVGNIFWNNIEEASFTSKICLCVYLQCTKPKLTFLSSVQIAYTNWNHLDFLWGIDAPELVYSFLLKNMATCWETDCRDI